MLGNVKLRHGQNQWLLKRIAAGRAENDTLMRFLLWLGLWVRIVLEGSLAGSASRAEAA